MLQKRTTGLLLIVGLLFPNATSAAAMLTDITGRPEQEAITGLLDRGVVTGYEDHTFRPDRAMNRAEFIKILIGARFGNRTAQDVRCFTDLEVKTPQWYADSVCSARELGIVSGYPDGSFQPDRTVNLAEGLKMAFRSFGIFPVNVKNALWYESYLDAARDRNILLSLLKNPAHLLTRGNMAELTYALTLEAEDTAEHPVVRNALCGDGIQETPEQCDDGNTADSDGCSSICILVSEPLRRAIVQIDAQATGTVSTVAQGERAVTLLKFTATAGRQDALLTSLTFTPTVGSLLFAKHYTLRMDRSGTGAYDTIVQADGRTDGAHLIFGLGSTPNMGVLLPKGLSVPFIITADLVSTLGPVSLGINFATTIPNYVEAEGAADGLSLTGIETDNACTASDCFIRVNTRGNADINVVERGSLFITDDPQPAINHILLGGSITPPLLKLRFRATGEDIDVHELRIDGVTDSVDSLLLSVGGTTMPFAQASSGQCTNQPASRMCAVLALSTLLIPANRDISVLVSAKLKTDANGGTSGENLTLSLRSATDESGLAIKARGISSKQDLPQNNGDTGATGEVFVGTSSADANRQILGRTNDTALAGIRAITNAGAAAGSSIPSGNAVIGAFRIDALAHTNSQSGLNDVALKTLSFHVSAQNVQLDPAGYRLTTSEDQNAELPCTATETTGDITVTCSSIDNGSIGGRIGQGQWKVFALKANVTNTAITQGTSSLVVELPLLGTRSQTNSVIWSDELTIFTWVDLASTGVQSTLYRTH